ncbi:hypothetical protein FZC78_20010 [Rossellomorea vietnamensis]|uniref:Uncharacterized protein n=1 Tax=Rossellomorea vietnamensis TaxID=218284 RepID=A0A5D4NKQ1_9BACI|nr:hypothetical protein [Rossellomorea vietnamensis]TYS14131.1 hypothetical protein FZC78_20010 [Rossellomorea vietnamensis]
MRSFSGKIMVQEEKGSEVLMLRTIPVAKLFALYNEEEIELSIYQLNPLAGKNLVKSYQGIAEVFFFEGNQMFYTGTKYVNDFWVNDEDIIQELETLVGKDVIILVNNRKIK